MSCTRESHTFFIRLDCDVCDRTVTIESVTRPCNGNKHDGNGYPVEAKRVACSKCETSITMYFHCTAWAVDEDFMWMSTKITDPRKLTVFIENRDRD